MTNQHPITPTPELVQEWLGTYFGSTIAGEVSDVELVLATQAARWGADQQLEKDAKWLDHNALSESHLKVILVGDSLKEAMRPKPPSLKEQALEALKHAPGPDYPNPITLLTADEHALIRRALEQLPND